MLSESFPWVSWSCSCLHYARWEWGTEVLCWLGNMSCFPAAPYGWFLNCPNLKTLRTPKPDIILYFHSEPFWRIWLKGNRFHVKTNWVYLYYVFVGDKVGLQQRLHSEVWVSFFFFLTPDQEWKWKDLLREMKKYELSIKRRILLFSLAISICKEIHFDCCMALPSKGVLQEV